MTGCDVLLPAWLRCSTKGLSAEELLVYQVIKQAGNTGELLR